MKLQRARANWNLLPSFLGIALLSALLVCGAMKAQTPPKTESLIYSVKGPDLFRGYCAVCHGTDGHGDGPMAPNLKSKVPDLTTLARNNKGQFPAARVRRMIEGTETVTAHGSREMPIWGPIFHRIEDDRDFGNVRLDNLLKYVQSIQQK
jgi:mono/diheme cytochrome c family protein